MELRRAAPSPACPSPNRAATEVVRAVVIETLGLEPADFDPGRSLAEMGCSSLDVIDIQYRLESELGLSDLGLDGPADFDPLRAPVHRLEEHIGSIRRA